MVCKSSLVFFTFFMKVITAFGMERAAIDERLPLLPKTSSAFLKLPPEISCRIDLSLQTIQDAAALQSTSKTLSNSPVLKELINFARQLVGFQKHATANPPFFNEDRESDLKNLLDEITKARESMLKILKIAKVYKEGDCVPAWATLYHELSSRYTALELNLKNVSHPLHRNLRSLKEHSLIVFPRDEKLINDVVNEYGGGALALTMPFWHKLVHTIGRNKKILILGTFTMSAACIVGTFFLMQYPPFNPQAFIAAYDSDQTGQMYGKFSYGGVDLPESIAQDNWCMPNGKSLRWNANEHYSSCNERYSYMYTDPRREPPHSDSGWQEVICDKTALDAATFLYERCGFNPDFWYPLLEPFNNWSYEIPYGRKLYCNLHPSNQSLVCANLMGLFQVARVNRISEISLASVAEYYNHHYVVRASTYGGFMGFLTFAFLGFVFWSWCLGEI